MVFLWKNCKELKTIDEKYEKGQVTGKLLETGKKINENVKMSEGRKSKEDNVKAYWF